MTPLKLIFHNLRTPITLLAAAFLITSHTTHAMRQCAKELIEKPALHTPGFTTARTTPSYEPYLLVGALGSLCYLRCCKPYYHRYYTQPTQCAEKNADHKAPEQVQQLAITFAKAMCRSNPGMWLRYLYAQACGYLIVYDGESKEHPDYFTKNTNSRSYTCSQGGIYFPQKSFLGATITHLQQAYLCHEVAHIMLGHTLLFRDNSKKENKIWFEHEYCAEHTTIETLFQLKKYKTIVKNLTTLPFNSPYQKGALDALAQLKHNYPDHKGLKSWCKKYKITPKDEGQTWETRYEGHLRIKRAKKRGAINPSSLS